MRHVTPPPAVDGGRSGAGPVSFSTVGLPVSRRLELWEHYNARALVGLTCTTVNESPLAATESNVWLPRLEFARVTGNPHVVERTARQIRTHPADAVVLYLTLAGEAFFHDRDGVRALRPGQAVLCDADVPFLRGFSRRLEELALKVPRAVFEGITDGAPPRTPRVFDLGDGHGHALAALMDATLRGAHDGDRARAESDALGLLRALVVGAGAAEGGAHLRAARAFIERHLREPGLSAARVAAAIGISERQLSRVFAREGTGVARWILDRRLDLAHAALTSPTEPAVPIGRLARECGFASPSYFTRAFGQRFAVTPGEARRHGPRG
jgi:AraC-like DNA-binding protein